MHSGLRLLGAAAAAACVRLCIAAQHDCTDDPGACCAGYTCQSDTGGYGTCK